MLPVTELPENQVLIGVDGGATEMKAHEVLVLPGEGPLALRLGAASASWRHGRVATFRPVPVEEQLRAREDGRIEPTPLEREQGELWIDSAARSIRAVAAQARSSTARVAMCMPGIKTADGRGIAVARNGPRIPDFLDRLEERLAADGLPLARPIRRLSSDGLACGFGEEADASGLFRDVSNAYYVGGGTGLAESVKLDGRILGVDALPGWRKAWQLERTPGRSFEDVVSMHGMNESCAARSGPVEPAGSLEDRAVLGDAIAVEVLAEAADALAELVTRRILDLRRDRGGSFDRIVLGQHLGRLHVAPDLARVFRDRVDAALRARRTGGAAFEPGFVRGSTLRAAPAIGAVAIELDERRAWATR